MKVYAAPVSGTYQIKEVADRSGFSAATLRYYEQIGLLPAAIRTPAGYRLYDDQTLDRLAFIARAKQLGCGLDEIADLTVAWDGGRCGPIQDRLRAVVAEKVAVARQQIVELMTLTSELQRAAASLEAHRPDGPCDDSCGCVTDTAADAATAGRHPVAIGAKPSNTVLAHPPIACTLGAPLMKGRLDEWQRLLAHVEQREPLADGLRVSFEPSTPLDELIRLAAAEQDCCQFFTFAITIDTRGIALEIHPSAEPLALQSLFGRPG